MKRRLQVTEYVKEKIQKAKQKTLETLGVRKNHKSHSKSRRSGSSEETQEKNSGCASGDATDQDMQSDVALGRSTASLLKRVAAPGSGGPTSLRPR